MPVELDLRERARTAVDIDGYRATRIAWVTGLAASTPDALLYDAIQELAAATPESIALGDSHPTIPGVVCINIDAKPGAIVCDKNGTVTDQPVLVECTYGKRVRTSTFNTQTASNTGPAVKQIRSAITGKVIYQDINGNPLTLERSDDNKNSSEPASRIVPVRIEVPVEVITFERLEVDAPRSRSRTFRKKTNTFTEGPYPPKTLLCERIDSVTRDAGITHEVTYEFLYNPDGHQAELAYPEKGGQVGFFTDPSTEAKALKKFDVYEDVSYAGLDLDFSD